VRAAGGDAHAITLDVTDPATARQAAEQVAERFGHLDVRHVARTLAAFAPLVVKGGGVVEPRRLNGRPGAIFRDRDGLVLSTWVLDMPDGRIRTIHTVNNPDKLSHIGPVADAWAALREANQAPRQGNSNR
jgi:NAD(P)-dependent dehydrogenase (short-subunit alcohol dehydrogenase family)